MRHSFNIDWLVRDFIVWRTKEFTVKRTLTQFSFTTGYSRFALIKHPTAECVTVSIVLSISFDCIFHSLSKLSVRQSCSVSSSAFSISFILFIHFFTTVGFLSAHASFSPSVFIFVSSSIGQPMNLRVNEQDNDESIDGCSSPNNWSTYRRYFSTKPKIIFNFFDIGRNEKFHRIEALKIFSRCSFEFTFVNVIYVGAIEYFNFSRRKQQANRNKIITKNICRH